MFGGPSFQTYYASINRMVRERLDKESPKYLLSVDPEEFTKYLVEDLAWEPLRWDEGRVTIEPYITRQTFQEGRFTAVGDQSRLRVRIPVEPHPQLGDYLQLQPSTQHSGGEPTWSINGGFIAVDVPADDQAVEKVLKEVQFWLGGRNRDIETGNAGLRQQVEAVWLRRRRELESKASELSQLVERLRVPLHHNEAAPKPIPARRLPATPKPSPRPAAKEPELERDHVINVVKLVEDYTRQFEVSPQVYSVLGEEQLRDLVLGMLNVHFSGSTGESFSKLGKTDLMLRVHSEGSLIGECKLWTGAKAYAAALHQLFGYLTWRHSYAILVTFCTNKDMTRVVTAAADAMSGDPSLRAGSFAQEGPTRFRTTHRHPQDDAKQIEVFHLFVDLSLP